MHSVETFQQSRFLERCKEGALEGKQGEKK